MESDYGASELSTLGTPNDRSGSSAAHRRKRSTIRVACNVCRLKKTRCDGRRPTCGWCALHPGMQCVYDTESAEETRSAAIKRENEILKRQLDRAERLLWELVSSPEDTSIELLNGLRRMGVPPGESISSAAYGYAEPYGLADSPGNHLPPIRDVPDGVDMSHLPRLNPNSTAARARPGPKDARIAGSQELGQRTPEYSLLIKRPSAGFMHVLGGVQQGAAQS